MFSEVVASPKTVNGILHPFDLAFDPTGNICLSSQDTNVVTGIDAQGKALPVAPLLANAYPGGHTRVTYTWNRLNPAP